MMSVIRLIKSQIERYSIVTSSYRAIRDIWRIHKTKPKTTPYGFRLMGNKAMQVGTFEPIETALIQKYMGEIDVFVDVGANIGFYTCLARSFGKRVIAIEPLPQNLNYLYANLEANSWDDVEVFPVGLSDSPGITPLYGGGTGASLIAGWAGVPHHWNQIIALSTLDILLGERFIGKKLFIKIDVEGVEYKVLMGSQRTLAMTPPPIWMVEICLTQHHPRGLNPYYMQTFEIFWQHGYEAYSVDKEIKLVRPMDVEQQLRIKRVSTHNYLFIKDIHVGMAEFSKCTLI